MEEAYFSKVFKLFQKNLTGRLLHMYAFVYSECRTMYTIKVFRVREMVQNTMLLKDLVARNKFQNLSGSLNCNSLKMLYIVHFAPLSYVFLSHGLIRTDFFFVLILIIYN